MESWKAGKNKAGKLQLKAGKLEMLWKAGKNKAGNAIESWTTKVINMNTFYQSNFMIFTYIYIYMDFKFFKKA